MNAFLIRLTPFFILWMAIQTQAQPMWESPSSIQSACEYALNDAEQQLNRILLKNNPATELEQTESFNRLILSYSTIHHTAYLMMNAHPDADIRASAKHCSQAIEDFESQLWLNPDLYAALSQINVDKLNTDGQRFINQLKRDFIREGINLSDNKRQKLASINQQMIALKQAFSTHILEDVRYIAIKNIDSLAGLPVDYIAAHPSNTKGEINLSTNYPDYIPFMQYAHDEEARKRLYVAFNQRGYPKNKDILPQLLTLRHEKARLLGFENFADYVSQNMMIKNGDNIAAFIDSLSDITYSKSIDDINLLLETKKQYQPTAKQVYAWDIAYLINKVKENQLDFDPKSIRPYFNYEDVKQAIMAIFSEQFGLSFTELPTVPVWHPSVTAWQMSLDKQVLGTFYLDMHPREGKYKHAAMFHIQEGLTGKTFSQPAKAALLCNFPEPSDTQPALMEHRQVVTFFHEFGHLIHQLLAQPGPWITQAGISNERDFVEAPSQLLEEWAYDTETLQRFARHIETNQVLPKTLAEKINQSRHIAKAYAINRQLHFADYSFLLHRPDIHNGDLEKLDKDLWLKHRSIPYVEGTLFYPHFGHLTMYSAVYYTYMWSLAISKDLFSQFQRFGINNKALSFKYRDTVLRPGATKDADDLLKDFLGRPFNDQAFKHWLSVE